MTPAAKQVLVPSVLGEKQGEARTNLEDKGFEVVSQPGARARSKVNTVLEQDPDAGKTADEGSTVTITVSAGSAGDGAECAGQSEADAAKKALEARGFKQRDDHSSSSPRTDPGTVISTDPPGGAVVNKSADGHAHGLAGPEPRRRCRRWSASRSPPRSRRSAAPGFSRDDQRSRARPSRPGR